MSDPNFARTGYNSTSLIIRIATELSQKIQMYPCWNYFEKPSGTRITKALFTRHKLTQVSFHRVYITKPGLTRCPRDFAPPPPVISPSRGQIPRDLATPGPNHLESHPPCMTPFRNLYPPPTTQFREYSCIQTQLPRMFLKCGLAIYLTIDLRESEAILSDIFNKFKGVS